MREPANVRAVVCDEPHKMRFVEQAVPEAAGGEAIVKIHRVGVCGTDLHAYRGEQPFFSYPRVLGHELAAEVLEAPDGSGLAPGMPVVVMPYLACGRCIACRRGRPNCCCDIRVLGVHADGGMRERMAVPASALIPAPATLDWEQMALVECIAIGAHAVRRAAIEPGEFALVAGCGPIGLGTGQLARRAGARVIGMDLDPERLRFWREALGFEWGVQAGTGARAELRDITNGDMPTVVFDATGHAGSMAGAIELTAHGGRVVWVGLTKQPLTFLHTELHKREATLLASRNATAEDFRAVIDAIAGGELRPACMVTHRTRLEDVPDRFEAWTQPGSGVIKAIVEV